MSFVMLFRERLEKVSISINKYQDKSDNKIQVSKMMFSFMVQQIRKLVYM